MLPWDQRGNRPAESAEAAEAFGGVGAEGGGCVHGGGRHRPPGHFGVGRRSTALVFCPKLLVLR